MPDPAWPRLISAYPSWPDLTATATFDYIWTLMTTPDLGWPHLTSAEQIWPQLTTPDLDWLGQASADYTWTRLTTPDLSWPCLNLTDYIWPQLTTPDLGWPHLTSAFHSRPQLTTSNPSWPQLTPSQDEPRLNAPDFDIVWTRLTSSDLLWPRLPAYYLACYNWTLSDFLCHPLNLSAPPPPRPCLTPPNLFWHTLTFLTSFDLWDSIF